MSVDACNKIIFPLDVPDLESAEEWVDRLSGLVGLFKVGLELFAREGPAIVEMIRERSRAGIFLDLKFLDIPATMGGALRSAAAHTPRFITIHAHQGEALKGAVSSVQDEATTVLAVTVLTSISPSDLKGMGMRDGLSMEELVDIRMGQALEAGCGGVVCSGLEVAGIRERFGKRLVIVVPGIRPRFSLGKEDDQQRIATPSRAIRDGADYLVIGRPIRKARDPVKAAGMIAEEIGTAL